MRRASLLFLVFAACSRDLTTPPLPGPGGVNGHVVSAVPGKSDRRPAVGAVVSLVGSGLETTTNAGGTFALDLDATDGLLLFRFDSDKDGTVDQQLVLRLSDYGVAPHKRVDLGEVLLGQNAGVHGRVLRADVAGKAGHGGTSVFVPEGPFSTTTADDGSFQLANLPSGPLTFMVFRAGYTAVSLGEVTLRPGEDFAFRDVALTVSTEPQVPGTLKGALAFNPPAMGRGDSAVSALAPGQMPIAGTVADDAAFTFPMLPPGLYTITASRSGYVPARASNVLVLPGAEASVATITLGTTPAADAGQPPPFDAGTLPGLCAKNAQCGATEWCDDGWCAPQCATTAQCTNGRACDPATRTCVTGCTTTCPAGLSCDVAAGVCRASCDSSFPCDGGFTCDAANRCVPECATNGDCKVYQGCHAGQCQDNTLCVTDLQCAPAQLCLTGGCVNRPTAASDAGVFACTTACHCRQGEWCQNGSCLADPLVATFFFQSDAGPAGTGATSADPARDLAAYLADAGADERFALRAGDTFSSEGPFAIDAQRFALAGGYVACAPGRWVRDPVARTTLRVRDGGTVLDVNGPGGVQLDDVTVANLQLQPSNTCAPGQVNGQVLRRFRLENLRGGFTASNCGNVYTAVVRCQSCIEATVQGLAIQPSQNPQAAYLYGLHTLDSFGHVEGVRLEQQTQTLGAMSLVEIQSPAGPVDLTDLTLTSVTSPQVYGVYVNGASAAQVSVENSSFAWPVSTIGGNIFYAVEMNVVPKARVANNVFDGTGIAGPMHGSSHAVHLLSSAGVVTSNTVRLPSSTNGATLIGVLGYDVTGPLDVTDNRISGGASPAGTLEGIHLESASGGPVLVARNDVQLGEAASGIGLYVAASIPNGLTIEDNLFSALGLSSCATNEPTGAYFYFSKARAERNRFFADRGGRTTAVRSFGSTELELYSNHLWAGASSCAGYPSTALDAYGPAVLSLKGNTLDPRGLPTQAGPTRGLVCVDVASLAAEGNIVGGGRAADHLAVQDTSAVPTCSTPANWSDSYFWYEQTFPTPAAGEGALDLTTTDAGEKDPNGNLFNFGVSCFADAGVAAPDGGPVRPYRLAANSPCVDTGHPYLRKDTSVVEKDIDGKSRLDAGARPDLGASER